VKAPLAIATIVAGLATTASLAQPPPGGWPQRRDGPEPQATFREDALDPTPIDPAVDPNIDLFINDYHNARPRTEYGKLVFRDILTKLDSADPVRPVKKGAVLTDITALSYATLAAGNTASGRAAAGSREIFFATAGAGTITVNSKSYEIRDGVGFTLTPDFDFKLTSAGKEPLAFYVRAEPLPGNYQASGDIAVVNRFDNDRGVGAHWVHICNGGPSGMNLCTIAPHTIPQPHSHAGEEVWAMVKGETILSLGKHIVHMVPGQAYKIPPTGITAHSNLNMGEEPVEMIYMGPATRAPARPAVAAVAAAPAAAPPAPAAPDGKDYSRLDNKRLNPATEPDIDLFMGSWRDAPPRIMHGNLYFRDMLTALQGTDSLHPTRKGAVLTHAQAVSYAMLEPGSTAHKKESELQGMQQTFVVNSGTGFITSGTQRFDLSKGMAFIITPGLDFRLTATGDKYMTFYVVSEKIPEGFTPKTTLQVVDDRNRSQVTKAWVDKERPLITSDQGLSQYGALTEVELGSMTMSQPYSDGAGREEIWIATDGDIDMLMGKQLRKLPAGTAYVIPATGITAHANINTSAKTAKLIYFTAGG
jgi:mannose-6-phosphate isomerase-like protein (cupin superfamily)